MNWFKVVLLIFFAYEFFIALLGNGKHHFSFKRGVWTIIHLSMFAGTYFLIQ
jgi:hypothetical protein